MEQVILGNELQEKPAAATFMEDFDSHVLVMTRVSVIDTFPERDWCSSGLVGSEFEKKKKC